MTCREKLKIEHPECIDESICCGCSGCPHHYGYLDRPSYCTDQYIPYIPVEVRCTRCWDREIPETLPFSQAVPQGEKDSNEPTSLTLTVTYNDGTREKFFDVSVFDFSPQKGMFEIKYINPNKRTYISASQVTKIDTKIKELV